MVTGDKGGLRDRPPTLKLAFPATTVVSVPSELFI